MSRVKDSHHNGIMVSTLQTMYLQINHRMNNFIYRVDIILQKVLIFIGKKALGQLLGDDLSFICPLFVLPY